MDYASQKLGADGSPVISVFRGQAEIRPQSLISCHLRLTQFTERSLFASIPVRLPGHDNLMCVMGDPVHR